MNDKVGKLALAGGAFLPMVLLFVVAVAGDGVAGASGPAPVSSPVAVAAILSTTAMLRGAPNPEGQPAQAWFEYGTTSAYGSRTPGQSLGSGSVPVPISALVSGLAPDTTYHVRLDVQSASATVVGPDSSFTTSTGPTTSTLPPSPASARLLAMKVEDHRVVQVYSVACTGPTSCWAAGSASAGPLIERDRAGFWTPFSAPSPGPDAFLTAIDCLSAADCWAVGAYGARNPLPLAMHYNGRSWMLIPAAVVPGAFSHYLSAVDCVSAADCWAVGGIDEATPQMRQLIEHWNGRVWSVEPSPDSNPLGPNLLSGVSCSSVDSCWAVGGKTRTTNGTLAGLMMHWNGASWTATSTATTSGLEAVTCKWLSACFAINATDGVLQMVGGHWINVTAAVSSTTFPQTLSAISCSGPHSCWIVGAQYTNVGPIRRPPTGSARAEFWDGIRWVNASVQDPNGVLAYLNGVACTGDGVCVAVGMYEVSSQGYTSHHFYTHFFADQTPVNRRSS